MRPVPLRLPLAGAVLAVALVAPLSGASDDAQAAPAAAPDAPPAAGAPAAHRLAVDPHSATAIAARIIRERAIDCAGSGDTETGLQLEALADGLLNGRISLGDAALVMQIAGAGRTRGAPATAQANAATHAAVSALDGDAGDAAPIHTPVQTTMPPPATPPSAGTTPLPLPAGPAVTSSVLSVNTGDNGKVTQVAIGRGKEKGVQEGQRFRITRHDSTIAEVQIHLVKSTIYICNVVPNTLTDPTDDIRVDDTATLLPP